AGRRGEQRRRVSGRRRVQGDGEHGVYRRGWAPCIVPVQGRARRVRGVFQHRGFRRRWRCPGCLLRRRQRRPHRRQRLLRSRLPQRNLRGQPRGRAR
ncbi:unnamed protein product, partial [Ectocarpus sp. 12 AP-2014]